MPGVRANAGYSSITPSRARREDRDFNETHGLTITSRLRSIGSRICAVKLGKPALPPDTSFHGTFAFTSFYVRPSESLLVDRSVIFGVGI